MLYQVFHVFLNDWTLAETVQLLIEFIPLFLPAAIWGAIPNLRKRGDVLLILFSLFTAAHTFFTAHSLIFDWKDTAARLSWPAGPFVIKLGFFHAACGASLLACLVLRRFEWTKSLLITLALYAASSTVIHLVEAFGQGRIGLAHLGPSVMHDPLFVFMVFWVLRKARDQSQAIYYVPR